MLVEEVELKKAISACGALIGGGDNKDLLDESERMFCQVTLHKIPTFPNDKEIRKFAVLPNRLYPADSSMCLIVSSLVKDDEDATIEEATKLLKDQDITFIDTILPLDKLKKEYKGHELKRKLAQGHEVFFIDSRISRLAQSHLGTAFRKRRRIPFNIRMENEKKIKTEMESALRSAQIILTTKGPNLNILFATTEMTDEQKLENLQTLLGSLGDIIPRGTKNIKTIYLQGTETKAVPIYRNAEVSEELNEKSGIELERWAAHKAKMEIIKEVQVKQFAKAKAAKKGGGKKRKMTKGTRKAKRAKLTEKTVEKPVEKTVDE